jgi:hypothetical protein
MRGHVVDYGCDTHVKSFVVHSPCIEQVNLDYEERESSILELP